jgi:hypothetical protein
MIRKPKLKDFLPGIALISLTFVGMMCVFVGMAARGYWPEGLIAMGLMLWGDMTKGAG